MQEFSSGIIVFRKSRNQRLYLLLHYLYKGDYWDFARGNIQEGETTQKAAFRETREETGLSEDELSLVEGFRESAEWSYQLRGQLIRKKVTYFLAETKKEHIDISREHAGFKWLSYTDALRLLRYKTSMELLSKAETFMKELETQ